MEFEHRELKHVCKFCNKSFPCGQSLGGHIRSHLINNETEKFISRVKFTSASNVDSDFETGQNQQPGHGLRENPKRTWRIADLSEGTSVHDKLCRECGKGFQSWKALFGHMKCHSEKEAGVNSINSYSFEEELEEDEDEDSWTCDNDSTNITAVPNRGRRSRRRRTRYMGTITTSSSNFSIANAAAGNTTSSVYEIEQEQEEVAMCLMMLSRDVGGHWGGLKFVAESSDNNSVFSEDPSSGRTSPIKPDFKGKKLNKKTLGHGNSDWNDKMKKRQHPESNFVKKVDQLAQLGSNKYNSSNVLDSEAIYKSSQKRSRFECTTCNKVFKSYQALGGHRASHKKIKGCFASKNESSENTIETSDSKIIEHEVVDANCEVKAEVSAKSKGHCCPVCQKVFPSGQALGGHKRSHLIGGSAETNKTSQTLVIDQKPEVRDFLDLNLPAPVEEVSSSSHAAVAAEFKPWWVGSSHNHEALAGLISN